MANTMIIGLIGRMQSGKSTTAEALFNMAMYHGVTFEIKSFAAKLKQIVSILTGIPVEDLEKNEVKSMQLGSEWDIVKTTMPCQCDVVMEWYHKDGKCANCGCPVEITHTPRTPRILLQEIGTDLFRNNISENVWVNALMSEYIPHHTPTETETNWLISDCRFPNEFKSIKDRGGIIIRCTRKSETVSNHPSETSLDSYKADYEVDNNGTKEYLVEQVRTILQKEGII